MSEYKENTVGWQLSQLKEPLKSKALGEVEPLFHKLPCDTLVTAVWKIARAKTGDVDRMRFWIGACDFYDGLGKNNLGEIGKTGWDMAKECAPDNWLKPKDGGEDKAIVDSPKKTTELFFYGGEIRNPFKEPLVVSPRGEMNSVIVEEDKIKDLMNANHGVVFWPANVGGISPAPIAFEWNDNSVIDFTTWNLKRIKLHEHRFEIENQDILDSFKRGDAPELWHQPEYPFGYTPPAPEAWGEKIPLGKIEIFTKGMDADSPIPPLSEGGYVDAPFFTSEEILSLDTKPIEISRKSAMQDWYDQLGDGPTNDSPAREIEAPQRAVVGYEEPKPIDTIEKKHELRIKNLEARVIQLEGVVGKLEQQIEYVYRNLPKDFDGTR